MIKRAVAVENVVSIWLVITTEFVVCVPSLGNEYVRVIAGVAFSLVLVVGAGLMVRTLAALNRVDPGFQPDRTFAAHLSLPETKYASEEEISEFVRQVEERTRSHPGVQAAGMVLSLPIQSGLSGSFFFSI